MEMWIRVVGDRDFSGVRRRHSAPSHESFQTSLCVW